MEFFSKRIWSYLGNLKFQHDKPALFVTSQFECGDGPSFPYFLYRVASALYLLVWLLASFFILDTDIPDYGLSWRHKGFFFIYLTNWGLIIQVIDTIMQAVLVANSFCSKKREAASYTTMATSMKVSWCLEAVNNGSAIFITVLYWTFIHEGPGLGNAFNIHKHLFNSVYVILNLCISARPVHLLHITCMILLSLIYTSFTLIYYWAGGRNPYNWARYVYPVLDWSKPGKALLTLLMAFPLQILFYLFCFFIYKMRVYIHQKFEKKTGHFESLN